MDEFPLGVQQVVLVRREDNEDGEFTDTSRVPVDGCSVQPQPASETYDTGQQARQRVRVFGPPELGAASARDAVEIDAWLVGGQVGEVMVLPIEGTPSTWADPDTGAPHHTELVLVYTAG